MNWRTAIYSLLPSWLTEGDGEKIAYTLAIMRDWHAQRLRLGVMAALPDHAPDDALALIGRDRKITRGVDEPRESYAIRLKRWLDDHPRRGGPIALLEQVGAYWDYAPNGPYLMTLWYQNGLQFTRALDGEITIAEGTPFDGDSARWARWKLIIHWHENVGDDGVWGDPGTWGDGGVWGSGMSAELAQQLRSVPREWNAAHCLGYVGLLGPEGELWGYPIGTWGDPGTWGSGDYTEIAVG